MATPSVRLFATVVLVLAVAHQAHAQLAPERMSALMIVDGQLADHGPFALAEERLSVVVDGQEAQSTLLQTYANTTGMRQEGHYQLFAGMNAHVDGFAYWNGEQKIVGEVFEKETARRVYERVVARKRDPGLLEQDGEGAFSFKVFPIEAGERKRVELRWSRWLDKRGHSVTFRAPVMRDDASVVVEIHGPSKNLRSPTHRLHVENVTGGVRVRAEGTGKGELSLTWDDVEPDWTPSLFVQPGGANNEGAFAISLAAPDMPSNAVAAKDVTIVIDRSGSMENEPITHAIAAAEGMVKLLHEGDRVNVISFSDEVDPLFKTPQPITADTRRSALRFIDELRAGGGTDIALALSTALKAQGPHEGRPRVVVFMTDGQSDADKALVAAQADVGDTRVFTLGLGKEVNRPLLQRLAAQKRGTFTWIESAATIEPEVGRLAAHIAKPLLVDISVDVEGANAVRMYPRTLPDLFSEDELLVTGRMRGTGPAKFVIHGTLGGKPVTFTKSVDLGKTMSHPWVTALWAQSRVQHLLEEIALGGKAPELTDEVIGLAVAYNFVTPYTSFLAVPESELGDMHGTIEAARAQKSKIIADHRDPTPTATPPQNPDPSNGRPGLGTTADGLASNAPVGRSFGRRVATKDDEDDDRAADKASNKRRRFEAEEDPEPKRSADVDRDGDDEGGHAEAVMVTGAPQHHGCAGCTSYQADPASALMIVGVALILRRRRRTS